MISVKIHGRLGNQLFQYAFVYSTAKKLDTQFYLDETIDLFKAAEYFNITENRFLQNLRRIYQLKGFHKLLKKPKQMYFNYLSNKYKLETAKFEGNTAAQIHLKKVADHTLYEGFFQSEEYFTEQQTAIKKIFTLKKKYQDKFWEKTKHINFNKHIVTVHVRRGDYTSLGLALPINYYHEAIASISNTNNYYIFISDEPLYVAKEFQYIANKHISNAEEVIDLQYLIYANTNILSNSSFSWWGAYLNTNNALTIAPKNWLGKEIQYPYGITLQNWKLI